MTAQQEKDIRDNAYVIGQYMANREEARYKGREKPSYWSVSTNYTTLEIDGQSAFYSYGEAKYYAKIYVTRILQDFKNGTTNKIEDAKETKKYLNYVNSLEGVEFERAVLELRDILIETGALNITQENY
jgi:hypothetical protein